MDVLRKGGTLVVVGLYGGALSLPLPLLPQRSLTCAAPTSARSRRCTRSWRSAAPARSRRSRSTCARSMPRPQALADLRAGRVRGRVILQP